ncbi:hypothetical protein [Romeriopsis navalis]|nr:hypothetical protein [Romeriopsis navalis]
MSLVLGLGLSTLHLTASHTNATAAATPIPSSASQSAKVARVAAKLADGVYLYGQTNQPNQLNQAYFVFEVNKGNVLGALYMPGSSFDCAHGSFNREQLALKVRGAYEQPTSTYSIALDRSAKVATSNLNGIGQVGLSGFKKLAQVSQNDIRLLNTCKATYQAKAW